MLTPVAPFLGIVSYIYQDLSLGAERDINNEQMGEIATVYDIREVIGTYVSVENTLDRHGVE